MSIFKKFFIVGAVVLLLGGIYGCGNEGPAEKAGKKLDNAVEDVKEKVEDAGH